MNGALLLLADGRFPAGGHVHSAGIESAVADGRVTDLVTLADYVRGRLTTVGLTDAALSAATLVHVSIDDDEAERVVIERLDDEADARIPAPPLREASRRQGRQLVRVASRSWPSALLATVADVRPRGTHVAVAFGATGSVAGLDALDVASLSLHHAIATPTQAALRLLGLDPFAVAALAVDLGREAEPVAAHAADLARTVPIADLPAASGPIVDVAACDHQRWDMRLFAT